MKTGGYWGLGLLFLQVADVVDDGDFDGEEVSGFYPLVELGPDVVGVFSRHVDGYQVVVAGDEGVEEGVVLAALSVFSCGFCIYWFQVEYYITHGGIMFSLYIYKTDGLCSLFVLCGFDVYPMIARRPPISMGG